MSLAVEELGGAGNRALHYGILVSVTWKWLNSVGEFLFLVVRLLGIACNVVVVAADLIHDIQTLLILSNRCL